MMKKLALSLLVLTLAPAQALKLTVWDRDLSSKLGAGESVGTKFNVQLVRDYAGPVIVLFSQTDDEKRGGQFAGLLSRYDGLLKGGQLSLFAPADPDKPAERSLNTAASPALTGNSLSLGKLLQPFKLSVVLQPTSGGPVNLPETSGLLLGSRRGMPMLSAPVLPAGAGATPPTSGTLPAVTGGQK